MIVRLSPALAGPLAVAIANLRKVYYPPDPAVREELRRLQAMLQTEVNEGQRGPAFDAEDLAAQARTMRPLLVTYEAAGDALAISASGVKRLVAVGSLVRVGGGSGARVTVASIEDYVARAAGRQVEEVV